MRRIYLDYSATTPLDPKIKDVMMEHLEKFVGNASSIHSYGREARMLLEDSRERIARVIGANPEEIFFTSGGTESDNHAIKGLAWSGKKKGRNHVLISSIEHHAVLDSAESLQEHGFEIESLPVNSNGYINPENLSARIRPSTALISVIHANNEIGVIQPMAELSKIAKERGIPIHTDSVQSIGKIPVSVEGLGVDAMSLSAHKTYGPKGIGALYIRKGLDVERLIHGGSQELNRRAGTENIPLALGFAKTLELSVARQADDSKRIFELRSHLKERVLSECEGSIINGDGNNILPNILSVSFDSSRGIIDGDALIMGMDLRGVAVSSGSACTSGSIRASHVLLAIGRDRDTAKATLRFSLGRDTSKEEIDYAVDALKEVLQNIRKAIK